MPGNDVRGLSAHESFGRLVDLLPIPILVSQIIGQEGGCVRDVTRHVNRRFREVIGYTLEDFHDIDSWAALAYPDPQYREEVIGRWNRALEQSRRRGQVFGSVTAKVRCKDGRDRWFDVVAEIESSVRDEHHVVAFMDVTRIHEAMEEFELLSRTDHLTGTLNRRAMVQRLQDEINRALRSGRPFAVVMCDIDHFKQVNDTLGHQFGDWVIQNVASAIGRGLRATDAMARWGGEEFCLLLSETDGAGALTMVHRVKDLIDCAQMPSGTAGRAVTATFGIALYQRGEGIDDLLKRADAALYSGKDLGRDRVVMRGSDLR